MLVMTEDHSDACPGPVHMPEGCARMLTPMCPVPSEGGRHQAALPRHPFMPGAGASGSRTAWTS